MLIIYLLLNKFKLFWKIRLFFKIYFNNFWSLKIIYKFTGVYLIGNGKQYARHPITVYGSANRITVIREASNTVGEP